MDKQVGAKQVGSKQVGSKSGKEQEVKRVGRKGVKKGKHQTFHRYIARTLKQIHPEKGMKLKAMQVMDSMVCDMFDKLAREASLVCKHRGAHTISERDIEAAVKLTLPGDLSNQALAEAQKAITTMGGTGEPADD